MAESLARLEELNRRLAEARAAAEKARRLKAEFAAAVSHELRTPLNIIIGFAELLVVPGRARQATPVPDACRRQLEAIYRNACHISNLVDDILDLSQIDAHRLALHKEPVFLQDVVTEALDAVQHLFEDEGLSLTVDVPASIPQLQADRTRLRQILINLLSNAGRFTDEGGVAIRARTDNHDVVVEVSDTGIGIPPQHLPLVFGEFHQLGQPGRGGSGLGLSICKRLVELHGGNAWVESVVGQGSTFSFSLPLGGTVAATPDSPSLERSIAAITGREAERTVIVVDNDDGTSKIISRYLDGYHVEGVPGTPSPPPSPRGRGERGERAAAIVYCRPEDAESWRAARSTLPPGRTSPPGPPFLSGSDPERGDDVEGGEWRGEGMGPPGVVVFCPMRTIRHAQQELGVAGYLTKPVAPGQLRAALQRLGTRWRSVGIVEDHPEMADLLAEMVGTIRRRCRVWRATDGREALALLRERRPDVLLLDLLLPGLSGYQVLDEMRRDEGLREVPVLVITGAEDRDERVLVEMVSITRPGGMTVGEAMACLKHGLDSLCGTRWQTSVT
ncbi:MAG: response regulator [Chloroflexi bacterium]|nr:response regulator [Chloroflexota bacterium]